MNTDFKDIDRFLSGETTAEESLTILEDIASDPKLEEYVVAQKRLDYADEQMRDYGGFIPASSMAADDGRNLCDIQCETYILRSAGVDVTEEDMSVESRKNYWLRSQGMPLFNMGRLLESKGFLVGRLYDANLDRLKEALEEYSVIAVVNGSVLAGQEADILSDNYCLDDNPNHAVVVLSVSESEGKVRIFNPADSKNGEPGEYELQRFADAWGESRRYMVLVRKKKFPEEYIPQPVDVSKVMLNPDLQELTELIAENAHDVWAENRMKEGWTYGKVRDDINKKHPDMIPYSSLPEGEKEYDRLMALHTIKLVKRLGYRIINITSMYKCPMCGEVIEPNNNFCPNCGHHLSWEDFRL